MSITQKCEYNGCKIKYRAKGYCNTHYEYKRKHGSLDGYEDRLINGGADYKPFDTYTDSDLIENIIKYVEPETIGDECWIWVGGKSMKGYGELIRRSNGKYKKMQAHRLSYEAFIDVIPLDMTVDHLCLNKICVNPFHLEIVTREENTRRAWEVRNGGTDSCVNGHLWKDNLVYYGNSKHRRCKTCTNKRNMENYHKRKKAIGKDHLTAERRLNTGVKL